MGGIRAVKVSKVELWRYELRTEHDSGRVVLKGVHMVEEREKGRAAGRSPACEVWDGSIGSKGSEAKVWRRDDTGWHVRSGASLCLDTTDHVFTSCHIRP